MQAQSKDNFDPDLVGVLLMLNQRPRVIREQHSRAGYKVQPCCRALHMLLPPDWNKQGKKNNPTQTGNSFTRDRARDSDVPG